MHITYRRHLPIHRAKLNRIANEHASKILDGKDEHGRIWNKLRNDREIEVVNWQ